MRTSLLATTAVLVCAIWPLSQADFDAKQIYKNPLSHGFGEDINWVKWDDAVETAMELNKPIFLLIHKSWCHACKALKKTFQQSNARKAFTKLSDYFVMVNTEDDDEPFEEEYRPDGKYIPRLLFLDKNGDLLADFKNKKAEYKDYAYYYSTPADVLNAMKDVLKYYNVEVPELKRGAKLKMNENSETGNTKAKAKEESKREAVKKADEKSPASGEAAAKNAKKQSAKEAKATGKQASDRVERKADQKASGTGSTSSKKEGAKKKTKKSEL